MKLITIKIYVLICFVSAQAVGQSVTPDLQNPALWQMVNRDTDTIGVGFNSGIRLSETPGSGLMILKNFSFSEGILELDVKGENKPQQSFPGIAFHVQNDTTYEAVYFRPFNFKNEETVRQSRSVQYISLPGNDWETLREKFPGKYENRVNPVPDPNGWFHVKIVVSGKRISVFVNNAPDASLEVEKIGTGKSGGVALWTGNASAGSFANLIIRPLPGK